MILGVALGAALVVCLPFPADSESPADSEAISTGYVLRIGLTQSIDSLNPYVGLNDASYLFYSLVYDALACVGNDLEVVPNLATSQWAVPVDYDSDPKLDGMPYGSVWQYNLSTDAYWTDGEPFTADDVIYNIWLNAGPQSYDTFWAYQPDTYYINEAWKLDDHTVRISFYDRATGDPMPAAYADLLSIPMLPKHLMEQLPGGFAYIGMNWTGTFPEEISPGTPVVGTGPFMATPGIYSEWISGDHITLVRNPFYHWASDYGKLIKFDRIVLRFFQDPASMVSALKESDIDVAAYPPTAYDAIKGEIASGSLKNVTAFDGLKVPQYFTYVGFCMAEAGPNQARLDPVVRQALHMAVNKTYITGNMYLGYADEGTTLIPPVNSYWHHEPTVAERFNVDLSGANDTLEAAGYIDIDDDNYRECTILSKAVEMGWATEGDRLELEMFVRKEHPEEKDIATYLKDEWKKIGVLLKFSVVEELTLSQIAYSYAYDSIIWDWAADPDPNYILFVQSRSAWHGWSDNKYYNPAFDENYTNSVKSMDKVQRKAYVDNCQRIHYNDSAYIILAYPHETYAWRNDTFSGWGDWAAHPGRSLGNYWTGNPLLFDLYGVIPVDIDPPSANAGPDQTVEAGTTVVFNGGSSTDDMGVVNYTWNFVVGGVEKEVYGIVSSWKFAEEDIYFVTLTVRDAVGQTDEDLVIITVVPKEGSVLTDYWWIGAAAAIAVAASVALIYLVRRRGG